MTPTPAPRRGPSPRQWQLLAYLVILIVAVTSATLIATHW